MIGQTLAGQYEIVRQLGSGGMGAVYEALSQSHERVAIKVIQTGDLARDKALVGRFHREAKAATGIDTEHIVRVLATGTDETNDQPFMVMEYLTGEDLHHLFHRIGPLTPDLALRVVGQVCIGLAKAHEARVVHRDIKPANIYLAERVGGPATGPASTPPSPTSAPGNTRIVKLLDFGIAKIKMEKANATDTTGLTRTGSMLGSPLYMSPEQARGSKSIDHRADIWSLGIVFYQMLTGKTPNQDIDALGELIIAICSDPPRPVQELAPWVPPEVAMIVHKTLRFDPADRYQTATDMLADIQAILPAGLAIPEGLLTPIPDEMKASVAKHASIPPAAPPGRTQRESLLPASAENGFGAEEAALAMLRSGGTPASPATMRDPGTDGGVAQSAASPPTVRRTQTRGPRLPVLLGSTAIAGAALAYALYAGMNRPMAPLPAPTHAVAAEPAPAPQATAAPKPALEVMRLEISPPDATVEVDGVAVDVKDGFVSVSGSLGSTHPVKLVKGTQERVQQVAITDAGLFPPKVALDPQEKKPHNKP